MLLISQKHLNRDGETIYIHCTCEAHIVFLSKKRHLIFKGLGVAF